jgi:hypothetical protein
VLKLLVTQRQNQCNLIAIMMLFIVIPVMIAAARGQPQVTLPSGEVRGTTLPVEGHDDSLVFYGVPYADPPTGQLRFTSPRPVTPWTGVRDGSQIGELLITGLRNQLVLCVDYRATLSAASLE